MQRINFNYSTKNIPLANPESYTKRLIEATEKFMRAMRWRAFFFLHPDAGKEDIESYGFNSRRSPPSIPLMQHFEDSMRNLIQSVQFRKTNNKLQQELKHDIQSIKHDNRMFVKADKTSNFYKMPTEEYNQLLNKNIQKNYRKANENISATVDNNETNIIHKIQLQDRIESTAVKEAFITLKDHKPNFNNNPTCRLINPTKSELGKVSKQILQNITSNIVSATKTNLWRKTTDVIRWFQQIPKQHNTTFISFDIVDFYPSIDENLLRKALDFATKYHPITSSEREIIFHTKNSLLYSNNTPWTKKEKMFDVTMGSFDGAETCEVVGIYILSQLREELGNNIGLYRDDGLAALNKSPRETENIKKKICTILKKNNLKLTIEANQKIVNYLDVTLDLTNDTYRPYKKPNDTPLYISTLSNHPPSILKAVPKGINQRLSNLSANEEIFNNSIPVYQEALQKSGHNYKLTYNPTSNVTQQNRKRNRTRKITWFNPPFDAGVKTNIGKEFHKILSSSFPPNHKLRKIFNKNTVKLSYSCMPNFKATLDLTNQKKMEKSQTNNTPGKNLDKCNCREKQNCPLQNRCLERNIVYQATVKTQDSEETYVGVTENTFKIRYGNHKQSFNNNKYRNQTELSKHIWNLKDKNKTFEIAWKIIQFAQSYQNKTKKCNLCTTEKYIILCKGSLASLNTKAELINNCRHKNKFLTKGHFTRQV